jgi:hypothetical protein
MCMVTGHLPFEEESMLEMYDAIAHRECVSLPSAYACPLGRCRTGRRFPRPFPTTCATLSPGCSPRTPTNGSRCPNSGSARSLPVADRSS